MSQSTIFCHVGAISWVDPVHVLKSYKDKNVLLMPRSHIHGLDAGLATDVHSWQSVLVRSFLYCIPNHM